MNTLRALVSIVMLAAAVCPCRAANAASVDRTAWFRDAKFGMFIHWGPYSVASVEASWPIMQPDKRWPITEAEYRALPQKFNPVKFDARKWVRLAKAAGQRYIVFTAKHHDGFVMFDSRYTTYKITNTPFRRDVAAELAAAAKAEGMPLGFYYSLPDMNHPGYRDTSKPASANWQGEPWRPEWALYLDYMGLQLTELLTRYGDVALLWFDDGEDDHRPVEYDGWRFQDLIHRLQPATLINNRLGVPGDYETPEQYAPDFIPSKKTFLKGGRDTAEKSATTGVPGAGDFRLWETCMTINETWAYNKNDKKFKSTRDLIRTLVDVVSKGGNFLLNVGPRPDGTIQPEFEERLRGIGAWLKVNGEAIYGTTYGPVQRLANARTTQKGSTIYLHIFDWPRGRFDLDKFEPHVVSATLLAGGKPLPFTQTGEHLDIRLPARAPDPNVTVIALKTQ